jgi:predicted dehydrogenase
MENVRLGVVGVGGMGGNHAKKIISGKIDRCKLTAVCDSNPAAMDSYNDVSTFTDSTEMIHSGKVDAVLIATPHYTHTTIGIEALSRGLHILVEKPISVHKQDCLRLIQAHKDTNLVFAAMFNQRTDSRYRYIKKLLVSGEMGEIFRVNWIITTWFRPQAYYGMPSRIRAFCALGKYHTMEVEDDVNAYFEYPNGATGAFIASTGEFPGTDRLEIAGDRGRIVFEGDNPVFERTDSSIREIIRSEKKPFIKPAVESKKIPGRAHSGQHGEILQNFIDAITDGAPLIAPAEEGIYSVEMANAMLYSSLMDRTIELPLDGAAYEDKLKSLIDESRKK